MQIRFLDFSAVLFRSKLNKLSVSAAAGHYLHTDSGALLCELRSVYVIIISRLS